MVTDPQGRRAGLDPNTGQIINDIPGAVVTEDGTEPHLILLPRLEGQYRVEAVGIAQGDYQLGLLQVMTATNQLIGGVLSGTTTLNQNHHFVFENSYFQESGGQVTLEAEHFGQRINGPTHQWNLKTGQSGYTGTSYLQPLPDIDALYQTGEITASPQAAYPIDFTTPGTYTVWLRGYPTNAAGDSVYVGLNEQVITLTGFVSFTWTWASEATPLVITSTGVSTVSLWMREDGLRIDRLLITTDTNYIPTGYGPAETEHQIGGDDLIIPLTRTLVYTYDNLYRLTEATYTTGESYQYSYDPVGNRLQQIISGDTTDYLYDAANRLAEVDGQGYIFDDNGNLLSTGAMTNTFDAANRLVETIIGPKNWTTS